MNNPLSRADSALRAWLWAAPGRGSRRVMLGAALVLGWLLPYLLGFADVLPGAPPWTLPVLSLLFSLINLGATCLLFGCLKRHRAGAWMYLLLGVALVGIQMMHLALIEYGSGDYAYYLKPWAEAMRGLSFSQALSTNITDYNVPYQYVVFLISRVPLPDLYLYKWFSMAFDLLCAALVMGVAERIGQKGLGISAFAFLLTLSWPTFVINSALWAQCDAVYAGLAVGGLYLALIKRPYASVACFALSLAFKLQAVFLLPVLLPLWSSGRLRLGHLLAFVGFYLLYMVPALLAGMPARNILTVYFQQAQQYKSLVLDAPSMYQLMHATGSQSRMFAYFGIALALTATLVLCAYLGRYKARLSKVRMVDAACLMALMIPFLLPRMHERYFYLAELCALCYVAVHPRRFPVALLVLLASLNGYLRFLQEFTMIPLNAGALVVLGVLCYLSLRLALDLRKDQSQSNPIQTIKEATP